MSVTDTDGETRWESLAGRMPPCFRLVLPCCVSMWGHNLAVSHCLACWEIWSVCWSAPTMYFWSLSISLNELLQGAIFWPLCLRPQSLNASSPVLQATTKWVTGYYNSCKSFIIIYCVSVELVTTLENCDIHHL